MTLIAADSKALSTHNEDFYFGAGIGSTQLFVVGDFARSEYTGINKVATQLLERILGEERLTSAPLRILLSYVASQFNNALLGQQKAWNMSFQCCAVFGAVSGKKLYYLPVGDCRIAVKRQETLFLLNGTLWVDQSSNLLPPVIVAGQQMQRGPEAPPSQVLGIRPEHLPPSHVEEFSLERDDQILLYSDGVDKVVSPTRLLEVLTNGKHAVELDEIVREVMKEADIKRSDDDRTFMIVGGPHEEKESAAVTAERKDRLNTQQLVLARLSSLEADIQRFEKAMSVLNDLKESAIENNTRVADLTSKVDVLLKKGAAGPSSQSSGDIQVIRALLEHLCKDVKQMREELGVSQPAARPAAREPLRPPADHYPPQFRQDRQVEQPAKEDLITPLLARDPGPSEAAAPKACEVKPRVLVFDSLPSDRSNNNKYSQEGAIHVNGESIDWRSIERPATEIQYQSGPRFFVLASKDAPSGWLTGIFLFLHLTKEEYKGLSGEELPAFLNSNLGGTLELLNEDKPGLLGNYRASLAQDGKLSDKVLKDFAKMIKPLRHVPAQGQPSSGGVMDEKGLGPKKTIAERIETYASGFSWKILAVVLGILVIIILVFFVSRSLTSGPPAGDQPFGVAGASSSAGQKKIALGLGADGRTLYLKDEQGGSTKLGYIAQYGKQDTLSNLMRSERFTNRSEAERWINENAKSLIVNNESQLDIPQGASFFEVTAEDLRVVSDEKKDNCKDFLRRVNNDLPRGVRNDFFDLTHLNPGVECQNLKEGDRLLVFTVSKDRLNGR
jgi:serine/threonine protein phosphatase PrpC